MIEWQNYGMAEYMDNFKSNLTWLFERFSIREPFNIIT